jgi:uncharacterized protein YbjT (DUF2867 family)
VNVVITGGTGYIGKRLVPLLVERGHSVSAIVREGSESRLPKGATAIVADPTARWKLRGQNRGGGCVHSSHRDAPSDPAEGESEGPPR